MFFAFFFPSHAAGARRGRGRDVVVVVCFAAVCACTVRLSGLIRIIGVFALLCSFHLPPVCLCVLSFLFSCLPSFTSETFLGLFLLLLPSPRPSVVACLLSHLAHKQLSLFFSLPLCKHQLPSFFSLADRLTKLTSCFFV